MRNLRALSAFVFLFTVACSSSSSSESTNAPTGGDGSNTDSSTPCVGGLSDALFQTTTNKSSRAALASGDGIVGVAFTDAKGDVAMGIVGADGTASTYTVSNPIERSHYGDYHLAAVYNQGKFGIGFDSERTTQDPHANPASGWQTASFVTVDAASGQASAALNANDDLDRTGEEGGEPVQASGSTPIATPDGFFVAWSDTRTAEPIQEDVNIAGWSGIYGFGFDLKGHAAMSEDAQVQQSDIAFGFTGVSTSKGILMAWGGRDSDNTQAWLYTRVGPSSGDFTPATPPGPALKLPGYSPSTVTGAVGADGNVLLVYEVRSSKSTYESLYVALVDASGTLLSSTKLAENGSRNFQLGSVAATSTGYKVAYASGKTNSLDAKDLDMLHVVDVDATGAIDSSNDPQTAIDGGNIQGNLAISTANGVATVYFAAGAAPALSLKSLTVCPAQ